MHFKGQHRDRANDDRRADDEEGVHPNGIAMPVTRQATTTTAMKGTTLRPAIVWWLSVAFGRRCS